MSARTLSVAMERNTDERYAVEDAINAMAPSLPRVEVTAMLWFIGEAARSCAEPLVHS